MNIIAKISSEVLEAAMEGLVHSIPKKFTPFEIVRIVNSIKESIENERDNQKKNEDKKEADKKNESIE